MRRFLICPRRVEMASLFLIFSLLFIFLCFYFSFIIFLFFFHYLSLPWGAIKFSFIIGKIFFHYFWLVINFCQNSERSDFDHKNYFSGTARPLLFFGKGLTIWSKVFKYTIRAPRGPGPDAPGPGAERPGLAWGPSGPRVSQGTYPFNPFGAQG